MAQETIFSKIIRKEIPANIVYQDELVTAFRDISPQAKTHILIIPNKVIPTVNDVTEQDEVTLGRLFTVAANIVGTNKPILNMAANLAPALDVDLSDNTAALKNKTTQQLNVLYHLYWYNTQGVTQVWPNQQESQSGNILLQPQEKKVFELPKPSTESTNYRLYLQ